MKGFTVTNVPPYEERHRHNYSPPTYSDSFSFANLYNKYGAMNVSAAYRATEIISDSIASLPIRVKDGSETKESELDIIFRDGSFGLTRYELIKMLIQSVILSGNGYALIERGEGGIITGLRFVESSDVQIVYDKSYPDRLYYTTNVKPGKVLPKDIIHLVKNSYDGIHGISVLSYASRSLGIAHATENSAEGFFKNGCNLAGVIECSGTMGQEQKLEAKSSWINAFNEGGNGVAILSNGMSYKPVQISNSDAQLLESRLFNVSDIARFFGISPVLLGELSHSSYSTLEATQQQFLLHTLQPYIIMLEEEFSRKLLSGSLRIDLDETEMLKTDKTALASYYSTLVGNGILTINEVREELGYPKVDGGDDIIMAYTKIEDNKISTQTQNNDEV